jgi:beta-glucosidase
MRGVHTPPLWGETKGMYPETDSLPKQPYPVRFAVGLVDIEKKNWQVEEGNYTVEIGASSRDIRLTQRIKLEGIAVEKSKCASWYNTLDGTPGKKEFVSVYGDYADAVSEKKGNFGMENSIMEMKTSSLLCRFIYRGMESTIAKLAGGKVDYNNPQFRMLMNSSADNPIKANMLFSPDVMTEPFVRFVLDCANGHFWRGLFRLLSTRKRKIKQE